MRAVASAGVGERRGAELQLHRNLIRLCHLLRQLQPIQQSDPRGHRGCLTHQRCHQSHCRHLRLRYNRQHCPRTQHQHRGRHQRWSDINCDSTK